MNFNWQELLVYLFVLWCIWRLMRKYIPSWSWQTQANVSYFFESKNWPVFKYVGRYLRPTIEIPGSCNTHCTSCKKCA
jgi:hypothetical protein